MNLLSAAGSVLVLALAGTAVLRFLWPESREVPRPARLALGYCVGCFLVAVLFFGLYVSGLPFTRGLVVAPVVLLAIGGVAAMVRERLRWPGRWWGALLPGAFCLLALAFAWARPVYGYDAVMMWALKAKVMFFAQTWPPPLLDPFTTAHTGYPPLVPGAQAFVFFWLGGFDDVASRVVFAAWFAAGAVLLWWLLGQWSVAQRPVWVLWWCALPVLMEQVKISYADLPLAVYLVVFYGATVSWLREPARRDWLWLAAGFGGMAFWVKNDALVGVGAGLAALGVVTLTRRWPVRTVGLAAAVVAALVLPWRVFVWVRDFPSDFALRIVDLPLRTAQVAAALVEHGFWGGGYSLFWPVFLVALAVGWRRVRLTENSWLALALVLGVAGVFAVYWVSTPDLSALLKTSLERLMLGLFVPGLLLGALVWPAMGWLRLGFFAVTLGVALLQLGGQIQEYRQVRRAFAGMTLMEQHVAAAEPELRRQIAQAMQTFPEGTHVSVQPRRSLWRHRFYYETYPYLIVDSTATNQIRLTSP